MVKLAPARCRQSFVTWEVAQHSSHLITSLGAPVKDLYSIWCGVCYQPFDIGL